MRWERGRAYLQMSYALDFDVCAHGEFFDGDACPALDRLAINFELFILAWKIDFMDGKLRSRLGVGKSGSNPVTKSFAVLETMHFLVEN